ncbi:hypothetical protein EDD85DRAFT_784299 [Armillaria nabsnona]|nr:hypothetical protein EDD85DRAFT_784299 [Armillaria nabsnona]
MLESPSIDLPKYEESTIEPKDWRGVDLGTEIRGSKSVNILNADACILAVDKAEKVARWLTPLDYIAIQQDKLNKCAGNARERFLKSPEFKTWRDGSTESHTLWSGVGLTIFASIIMKALQLPIYEETLIQKKTFVLNIFCDYRSVNTETIENILHSLLKQWAPAYGISDSITFLYDNNTLLSLDNLTKVVAMQIPAYDVVLVTSVMMGNQKRKN